MWAMWGVVLQLLRYAMIRVVQYSTGLDTRIMRDSLRAMMVSWVLRESWRTIILKANFYCTA